MARTRKDRAARRERTLGRMEKEGQGSGGSKRYDLDSSVKWFKPEKGRSKLDLVPYKVTAENNPFADVGELVHGRTIFVHYGVGPESDSVICPKTIAKRCPICEYIAGLDWDENEDEIRDLRASKRVLYNVIDLDGDPDEILFSEMAYANFEELLAEEYAEADDDDVLLGLDYLDDRPTLKVRFKESKFKGNKYVEAAKIEAIQGDDFDKSILDDVVDLDKCLIILSAEEIQKVFLGLDDVDEAGTGEDEKPEPEKKRSSRIKPSSDDSEKEDSGTGDDVPMHPGKEDEPEADEPEKEPSSSDKRQRKTPKKEKKAEKDEDNKCPAGLVWGVDTDKQGSCDKCDVWDDCMDEKERLEG